MNNEIETIEKTNTRAIVKLPHGKNYAFEVGY